MNGKFKEPTANMKITLLDLLNVVRTYDCLGFQIAFLSTKWYNKDIEKTQNGAVLSTPAVVSISLFRRLAMSDYTQIPLPFSPDVVEIHLSKQGKHAGKYVAIVDAIDIDLIGHTWWVTNPKKQNIYAACRIRVDGLSKLHYLHRIILERKIGRPLVKREVPDHINGNGLDNRRDNLRLATPSQNQGNKSAHKNSTTGYKGVSWAKSNKKFQAKITFNSKTIHLGHYDTAEAAHEAYKAAAVKYFGEFANFGDRD